MLHIRPRQKILQQVERRRVEPLQIVEEERQRMLGPCEYADKSPEHQLEAALRILWRKFWHRRLLAENEGEFGDQVKDELSVRAQRLQQGVAPTGELGVALAEQRPHEALESQSERRIGYVAL